MIFNDTGQRLRLVVYMAVTLVCVAVMISGVPLGAQMAWLSSSNTGIPLEVTRVAAVTQVAVRQGDGAPDTLKAQPATINGAGCITMG